MGTFYLMQNDTANAFETELILPNGSVHDPTGRTVFLHITTQPAEGDPTPPATITRTMTVVPGPMVRYPWTPADWEPGALIVGRHLMQVESVLGVSRLTFPNKGYDALEITADLANPPPP